MNKKHTLTVFTCDDLQHVSKHIQNTVYQNATQIYINIYIIAKFYILKISKNKGF